MTEPKPRKKHVRLYESQRKQIRHLGELGATWPAIVELYGCSETVARDLLAGKGAQASTGYRDLTGSVTFEQDPLQVRRVLGYGRGLRSVKEEREPYWQALLMACTAKPEAEPAPEPEPESEPLPPTVTWTNLPPNETTTVVNSTGANLSWVIHPKEPEPTPVFDELVRLVGELLEPSVKRFLEGLQRVAKEAVDRAVEAYTRP